MRSVRAMCAYRSKFTCSAFCDVGPGYPLWASITGAAPAIGDIIDAYETVLAAEKQYADAMVKGDAATLEKLLADDLSYTHSSALMETKADVLKGITSGKTKYKAIEFKTSKV